jgi:hypothetical protein
MFARPRHDHLFIAAGLLRFRVTPFYRRLPRFQLLMSYLPSVVNVTSRRPLIRCRRLCLSRLLTLLRRLSEFFSRSLEQGYYPNEFKRAFVTPVIKQTDLDASVASSYRPISNLSVLSKLFDRRVARRLLSYLNDYNLLPSFIAFGFRSGHSTDTAVLHVLSDISLSTVVSLLLWSILIFRWPSSRSTIISY